MLLSFDNFERRYINQSDYETKLFSQARHIINSSLTDLNKQRRLEKLFNTYLLKKEENQYALNPLWSTEIFKIFKEEISLFNNSFNDLSKSLYQKDNCSSNYIKSLLDNLSSSEIFSLFIHSLLSEISKNIDEGLSIIKSTLTDKFTKFLLKIHEPRLLLIESKIFIKNKFESEEDYSNFLVLINKKYPSTNLNNVCTYEDILLEFASLVVNTSDRGIDKRRREYKDLLKSFNVHFRSNLKERFLSVSKISFLTISICLDETESIGYYTSKIGKKTYDYVSLFNLEKFSRLTVTCYLSQQVPMVIKPLDWNYSGRCGGYILNRRNNMQSLAKPIKEGMSTIRHTKYEIDSLNIIQSKPYFVDKKFLKHIDSDIFKKENLIYSNYQLYELYKEYYKSKNNLLKHTSLKNIMQYFKSYNVLIKDLNFKRLESHKQKVKIKELSNLFGINGSVLYHYKLMCQHDSKFKKQLSLLKNYQFMRSVGHLYKDRVVYVVSRMDYRGRNFPVGRGINRASGPYKRILAPLQSAPIFTEESVLILKEYITMMTGIFKSNFSKCDLITWFDKNIEDKFSISDVKNLIYKSGEKKNVYLVSNSYYFLVNLVKKVKSKSEFLFGLLNYLMWKQAVAAKDIYFTKFVVPVDQSSSGPMIYSLLSRDRRMSFLTNALCDRGEKRQDLYLDFLNFLKHELSLSDKWSDIYSNFDNWFDRTFAKLLCMPKFYNMGLSGIKNHLKNYFKGMDLFKDSYEQRQFAELLDNLLLKRYPETVNFQSQMVNFCKILYKKNYKILFNTLDHAVIKYKYVKEKKSFRRVKTSAGFLTYRVYSPVFNDHMDMNVDLDSELDNAVAKKKHYLSFPPNFIHSIDGAICRVLCFTFYKLTNYILEPLHDSFSVPIAYYNSFQTTVKYVYLYFFFNEYFVINKIGLKKKCVYNISLQYNHPSYQLQCDEYLPSFTGDILNNVFEGLINSVDGDTADNLNNFLSVNFKNIIEKPFTDAEIQQFTKSPFAFYF